MPNFSAKHSHNPPWYFAVFSLWRSAVVSSEIQLIWCQTSSDREVNQNEIQQKPQWPFGQNLKKQKTKTMAPMRIPALSNPKSQNLLHTQTHTHIKRLAMGSSWLITHCTIQHLTLHRDKEITVLFLCLSHLSTVCVCDTQLPVSQFIFNSN